MKKRKLKFGDRVPSFDRLPSVVRMTVEYLDKLKADEIRTSHQVAMDLGVSISSFRGLMSMIPKSYRAHIENNHSWSYANPATIKLWESGAYNE